MLDSYLNEKRLVYGTEDGRKEFKLNARVPQGSVLGLFMWKVMYNDFLEINVQKGATLMRFADDAAAVITAETSGEL